MLPEALVPASPSASWFVSTHCARSCLSQEAGAGRPCFFDRNYTGERNPCCRLSWTRLDSSTMSFFLVSFPTISQGEEHPIVLYPAMVTLSSFRQRLKIVFSFLLIFLVHVHICVHECVCVCLHVYWGVGGW